MGSIASQVAVGTEPPGASASQAESTIASIPWRTSPSADSFPWTGALLLLVLVVVAVAAKAFARRQAGATAFPTPRWLSGARSRSVTEGAEVVTLESSVRLDPQTQLHVIRWAGRRVLVATCGSATPAVIDRASDADGAQEPRS